MIFDFAKATDITKFAKKHFAHMYNDEYEKIYIVIDVRDYHILRILKGYGKDYEKEEGSFILEHQKIQKENKESGIKSLKELESILDEDDGGNWDFQIKSSLKDCMSIIDGGHGIN